MLLHSVINHVLVALGRYPYSDPMLLISSHPEVCKPSRSSSIIGIPNLIDIQIEPKGTVARFYMGMAKGSPCVVPSLDNSTSPSANNSVGSL